MAYKVPIADGNWSTAGTWGSVTNTPTIHASTNVTLSTSNVFTATFTAPNTTNYCYGVCLLLVTVGTATITVTLQESTVDTAAARSISFTEGTGTTKITWVYFKFATPYQFTTTGAGAYRFKIVGSGITTASTMVTDSGGTLIAYKAVDDRTGVPASTDNVLIVGENYATTRTVTMDGTQTCGPGTDTATLGASSLRSVGYGLCIASYGLLVWDTASSATLTCLGHALRNGREAELRIGTVASPYPTANTATFRLNQNGTQTNYGHFWGPVGRTTLQGAPKSSTSLYKTYYVSGTGVAASPLVTSTAVDWSVGDEIEIGGDAYNEIETRFIITKNSSTSYVLSATAGGAEAAFSSTHQTDHPIYNIGRNIVLDTTDTTLGMCVVNGNDTVGETNVDWVRFNNVGSATINEQGIYISQNAGAGTSSTYGSFDYSIIGNCRNSGWCVTNSQTTETFTGLGVVNSANQAAGTASGGIQMFTLSDNKTFVDPFFVNIRGPGFTSGVSKNGTLTRPEFWGCNNAATASVGALQMTSSVLWQITDANIQACRVEAIRFNSATKITFTSLNCGDIGGNTLDIDFVSDSLNIDVHFESPTFGSATLISNYTTQTVGSKITMQNVNGNNSDHRTYEATGITRSTGTGLADTNVRTAGSLAWRIAPENNTIGMTKEFLILARADTAVSISGFIQKNSAFGSSTCTVELFLPGETTAAASQTMANNTDWQVFSLAASYTGDEDRYAMVRITAITATASAYVYVDDIYNGTNEITALDVFYKGEPGPIMFEQLGDAAAVWAVLTSTLTTAGTTGKKLVDDLTLDDFVGLK